MFVCRHTIERVTDDREGRLSGWVRAKYRFHMFLCAHCRAFRRQLLETMALASEIPADEVPPAVEDRALEWFRARSRKR